MALYDKIRELSRPGDTLLDRSEVEDRYEVSEEEQSSIGSDEDMSSEEKNASYPLPVVVDSGIIVDLKKLAFSTDDDFLVYSEDVELLKKAMEYAEKGNFYR